MGEEMTRRGFVASGAAALADAAFGSYGVATLRRAFQVYGIRDLCQRDLVGTLRAARDLGYEGVETGRFYGRSAAEWKLICADIGLELCALQLYPYNLVGANLAKTIRFCHESGCAHIATAWYKGSAENPGDWQLVVETLNQAAETCAHEGITIAYHNHDQEFRIRFNGRLVWDWLFGEDGDDRSLDQIFPVHRFSSRILQEFDPNWCAVAGADPGAVFSRSANRSPTIHVTMDDPRCNWRKLLDTARSSGTHWLVAKPVSDPEGLEGLRKINEVLNGFAKR